MFMSLVILLITLGAVIKTVSYGIYCIKDKNILGGIAVFLVSLLCGATLFITL